jgi:hypothetical protein
LGISCAHVDLQGGRVIQGFDNPCSSDFPTLPRRFARRETRAGARLIRMKKRTLKIDQVRIAAYPGDLYHKHLVYRKPDIWAVFVRNVIKRVEIF